MVFLATPSSFGSSGGKGAESGALPTGATTAWAIDGSKSRSGEAADPIRSGLPSGKCSPRGNGAARRMGRPYSQRPRDRSPDPGSGGALRRCFARRFSRKGAAGCGCEVTRFEQR